MRKFLFILILVLVAITSVQVWMTQDRTGQKKELDQAIPQTETSIGGAFMLTDQNGKTVSDSDFRGKIMLVFFGFTACPDECPATVLMFSKTLEALGAKGDQVAPMFISVDPKRDNPAALKEFLANFDKRIVGLTGTSEQIKLVEESYKVYAAKTAIGDSKPGDRNAEYNVDHSAYIYLMGKDGKFIKAMPFSITDTELVQAVTPYLSQ